MRYRDLRREFCLIVSWATVYHVTRRNILNTHLLYINQDSVQRTSKVSRKQVERARIISQVIVSKVRMIKVVSITRIFFLRYGFLDYN